MLIDLHLAAKHTAFCTILPCVLHQNALYLAPKRTAFSIKTHCVLRHLWGYAQIFESLSMKNFTPATPLRVPSKTFVVELKD
jgi:hypothetical protein